MTRVCTMTDLWHCVALQMELLVGDVRQSERRDVAEPLDLVDYGVSVGHVGPVVHGRLSGLSDHAVNLSLDLLCGMEVPTVKPQPNGLNQDYGNERMNLGSPSWHIMITLLSLDPAK